MPHGVLVGGGQGGAAQGHAPKSPHDPLRQQKVPKKGSHQQILAKELLEERPRQNVPRDGIRDGREDPIQFPQKCLPIRLLSRNAVDHLKIEALVLEQAAAAEPAQRYFDRGGEARREQVRRKASVLWKSLVHAASSEQNDIKHGGP